MKNYWLHRIRHEWEASYSLLEKGYLSYGWLVFSNSDLYDNYTQNKSYFDEFMKKHNETARSRFSLKRFFDFNVGDIIVIPMFSGKFSVYEITGDLLTVDKLEFNTLTLQTGETVNVDEKGIHKIQNEDTFDIGYLYPVKEIKAPIPRTYADAKLISRMKIRQANTCINDLSESVENAIKATSPVNVYDKLIESTIEPIKSVFDKYVDPDKLELIIKNYLEKKGADNVYRPAKNETGKTDGADADVIAEFYDLNIVIYVQVKKHTEKTGSWAVEQIIKYTEQKQDLDDDITYISWAVSTAEFSDEAKLAAQSKVRLIGGNDLMKLLINSGMDGIL